MRLIDADKLYPDVMTNKGVAISQSQLANAQSVQPSRKGHWVHFSQSDDCSECGYSTGKYESPSNFCPNCGCRMVGDTE